MHALHSRLRRDVINTHQSLPAFLVPSFVAILHGFFQPIHLDGKGPLHSSTSHDRRSRHQISAASKVRRRLKYCGPLPQTSSGCRHYSSDQHQLGTIQQSKFPDLTVRHTDCIVSSSKTRQGHAVQAIRYGPYPRQTAGRGDSLTESDLLSWM